MSQMFEGDFQDLRELRKMREEAQQIDLIDQPSDDSTIEEFDEFDEDSISNSHKDALSAENQQEIQPDSPKNEQFLMSGQIEKDTDQNPEHDKFQDRGLDHRYRNTRGCSGGSTQSRKHTANQSRAHQSKW
jgi:hypothetical protein